MQMSSLGRSRAWLNSRVGSAVLVSRPEGEEPRRRTVFGALRRPDVTALRRSDLVGLPPALERRLIAFPKTRDKAL